MFCLACVGMFFFYAICAHRFEGVFRCACFFHFRMARWCGTIFLLEQHAFFQVPWVMCSITFTASKKFARHCHRLLRHPLCLHHYGVCILLWTTACRLNNGPRFLCFHVLGNSSQPAKTQPTVKLSREVYPDNLVTSFKAPDMGKQTSTYTTIISESTRHSSRSAPPEPPLWLLDRELVSGIAWGIKMVYWVWYCVSDMGQTGTVRTKG